MSVTLLLFLYLSVSIGDKTCTSSLNHFDLAFLVTMVRAQDRTVIVQVGTYHSEVSLGFWFLLSLVVGCVVRSLAYCLIFGYSVDMVFP